MLHSWKSASLGAGPEGRVSEYRVHFFASAARWGRTML